MKFLIEDHLQLSHTVVSVVTFLGIFSVFVQLVSYQSNRDDSAELHK